MHEDILFSEWRDAYLAPRYPDYAKVLRGERVPDCDKHLRNLMIAADRFIAVVGDRKLHTYGPADFARVRSFYLEEGKPRPVTIENYISRVRIFFRAAEEEEVIRKAPRVRVRQVKYEKPALGENEIEEIFAAARAWPSPDKYDQRRFGNVTGRLYSTFATLYYTTMRRGELIHLTWNDIRTNRSGELEIVIQPKEWKDRKAGRTRRWKPKDHEVRVIPVHPVVEEVLKEQQARGSSAVWVFTNHKGERWSEGGLASLVRRFEIATGWKIAFHIWRRTGLTHLHDAGVPAGQVQRIAGHSSISTTMSYIDPGEKGRREAIATLKRF